MALKGQMINEGERATINYTLSDCGDHYTITPRCYFDTKGTKAKVKLDRDTGRLMIKPRVTPKAVKENERCGVSQMVFGGALVVPKKCDLTRDPVVRHEGPAGQVLVIDVYKKPEFCSEPKHVAYT